MRDACKSNPTIEWTRTGLRILDQTKLPEHLVMKQLKNPRDVRNAILNLEVRGAPAIGVAAAFGLVLAARDSRAKTAAELSRDLDRTASYLTSSRPTAVNLAWALERMKGALHRARGTPVAEIRERLRREALSILEEDRETCRRIGENGARLLRDRFTVLTHCNAGRLATAGWGTALGVIRAAVCHGKSITVYADETRPLLQGARLTTWELMQARIPVTLICDGAAPHVIRQGRIDCCIVGADRIAANGDTANKIGTYSVALAARENGIPFYIAAPTSTLDLSLKTGESIPIEERDEEEITFIAGRRIAPRGVRVYAPAFDVTPARYITAIVTEFGIARPPYRASLARHAGLARKKYGKRNP